MGALDSLIGIEDAASGPFEERRPGCGKRVISQTDAAQASIHRLEPGCGVPRHRHTRADDLFVGLVGEVLIHAEGASGTTTFTLRPGSFCRVPHGVRHEVMNASSANVAVFALVHAPYEGFDLVE